ncbi:unnamed protein product [Microthlaspi erraticum]|uniref:Retrotransposon gag domain-containing protein n=1 Tax=Microthlaspi erraticum TaxID=1685480 RepID=A0A6D2HQJ6_9BRAS|nr:unnamed protein product [Microthlaspi erraticum]
MAQGKDESLRKFVERFKTAAAEHSDIPNEMGIKAFENGLWFESKLKESLMLDEPATLQDALHRSQKYVCVEESKAHHSKIHGMTKESSRHASSRQDSSHQESSRQEKRRPLRSLLHRAATSPNGANSMDEPIILQKNVGASTA